MASPIAFLESILQNTFNRHIKISGQQFVSGGCINHTLKLITSEGNYFLKWNENDYPDMFEKEASGLTLLSGAGALAIPGVCGFGEIENKNYLIMEFINSGSPHKNFWEEFGSGLARQHQITNTRFGLNESNYIGRLPQLNDFKEDWVDFFIQNRLEIQLEMARNNGLVQKPLIDKFRKLYVQLPDVLAEEPASLLHGDLWSGNYMIGPGGEPFIIDPAVYYGNREIEIAFSQLFGGFDRRFYQSYNEVFPLSPGFDERCDIYNLYPLLVHVNLFGTSYLSGVERVLKRYC